MSFGDRRASKGPIVGGVYSSSSDLREPLLAVEVHRLSCGPSQVQNALITIQFADNLLEL
jgi:hypothetical protein